MGRLDLPDPVRDEDVWVSANELCKTRLCATPGCEGDAAAAGKLCPECRSGNGQLGLRLLINGPSRYKPERAPRRPAPRAPRLRADGVTPTDAMTPVELAVLRCAANGHTASQTAWRLQKSIHTVRTHRRRLLAKLGVPSIIEAVAIAFRAGLLT